MDLTFDIGIFISLLIAAGAYIFRRESKRNQIRFAIISELGSRSAGEIKIIDKDQLEKMSNLGMHLEDRATSLDITDRESSPTQIPTDHYDNFFNSLYILPDDEVQNIIKIYDNLEEYRYVYSKYEQLRNNSAYVPYQQLEDDISERYREVTENIDSTIELLRERMTSRRLFR